ncbi:MAG: fimbrillin family protein [Bacteroidaceae bacterium]|nr:fimbrillin family protein [Bacteroidaceae bacterium]
MKKSQLFLAAAAVILAACSSNDTFKEVNEDVAIGFNNYVAKATKGEITTSSITSYDFGVYGYKEETSPSTRTVTLFNNENVYYSNNDWTHDNIRYWDKNATGAYYFYAYVPRLESGVSFRKVAESGQTQTGFTYPLNQIFADATVTETKDLCVAAVEATDYNHCLIGNTQNVSDGHVSFTFEHVLSKLTFNIKKASTLTDDVYLNSLHVEFPSASTVTWTQRLKNVTKGNKIAAQGDIKYVGDVTYSANYADPTADTYTVAIITSKNQEVTDGSVAIADAHSYIVTPNTIDDPVQKHKINVKVGYTIDYGNDIVESQFATGVAEINFIENYHYTLTITIDPATIEFDVDAVNGWDEPHNENVDVH